MSVEGARTAKPSEPGAPSGAPSLPESMFTPVLASSSSKEEPGRDGNSSSPPPVRPLAEQPTLHPLGTQEGGWRQKENPQKSEDERRERPPQPAVSDILNRLDRMEGTLFGLKKSRFSPQVGYADNYEQKYEPDTLGEETGPNAQVWRVYMDEAESFDQNMIDEMRDALDVLLVFAALFSAIVTTFVSQTAQQLSPDYTQITALLVYESIQIQRAVANGTAPSSIPQSPVNPSALFIPDSSTVWVNGLWFTSLTLGLVATLAAVLVKQWLRQYMILPSGTVQERACTRDFRYMGFESWHVAGIVGALPVLVHISVGVFLAGIVVFLFPIQHTIALVVTVISGATFLLYAVVNAIPCFSESCPYRTPIGNFAYWVFALLPFFWLFPISLLQDTLEREIPLSHWRRNSFLWLEWSFKDKEKIAITKARESGHGLPNAIHSLWMMSSNPTVRSTVLQAIGGLPNIHRTFFKQYNGWFLDPLVKEIEAFQHRGTVQPSDKRKLECLLQAWCFCALPPEKSYLIPQVSNMFERDENGYAITLLLPTKFLSDEQRLVMIEDLMTDNILGRCTHELTDTMWDLLLAQLKSPLKLDSSSNAAFAFLRKIYPYQERSSGKRALTLAVLRKIYPYRYRDRTSEKRALTLAENLWENQLLVGGKVLLVLPKPVHFTEFCVEYDDQLRNEKSDDFILLYRLLLCYYDRLNGHALEKYNGVDLLNEPDCLIELSILAKSLALSRRLDPSRLHSGKTTNPWGRYQSFLEVILSSSPFWDVNPTCEPELLESICTVKAIIKITFTKSLNKLKGLPSPTPSVIARIEASIQIPNAAGVQGDLEMGLGHSSALPSSQILSRSQAT